MNFSNKTKTFAAKGSKGKQKKIDAVQKLADNLVKAKSVIFTDYRGLKHKQLEELRRSLAKDNAKFAVVKNRLMLRALGDAGGEVKDYLENTSAVLFAFADEAAPLKTMLKFFKTAGGGKTKGGLLGKSVMTPEDINKLAALPPKALLLGRLADQLKAPIQGFHYALNWNINRLLWALNGIKENKAKN